MFYFFAIKNVHTSFFYIQKATEIKIPIVTLNFNNCITKSGIRPMLTYVTLPWLRLGRPTRIYSKVSRIELCKWLPTMKTFPETLWSEDWRILPMTCVRILQSDFSTPKTKDLPGKYLPDVSSYNDRKAALPVGGYRTELNLSLGNWRHSRRFSNFRKTGIFDKT